MTTNLAEERIQIIANSDGKPEYVVIPVHEYEVLRARALDAEDILAALRAEQDEDLPWPMAKRLNAGENPVKVWREYRGLTQSELADAANTTQNYVSMIEAGKKTPTVDIYRRLAQALNISIDDLVD